MDTLANTPIFTEHLAFKADIQNDWTLCIKFPISELCRQLILLDAGSNYSVIRDFDADNWSCCTLDQITLQIEVCFWNRQLILPFYAGSNYSVLRGLMQTIDPVAYWIKLLCSHLQFYVDNWFCFMQGPIMLHLVVDNWSCCILDLIILQLLFYVDNWSCLDLIISIGDNQWVWVILNDYVG